LKQTVKPPRTVGSQSGKMKRSGTLKGWRLGVAIPAQYSSRMITAICAAFAAPLLRHSELSSYALYFIGDSKIGKSTFTLGAGSVVGFNREKALPNFRSTDAALSEMPREFNDHVLPVNELGLLRGNATERRQRLREFAYGLAEGHGTTYSKLSSASGSDQGDYHSIVIANGEKSSDDMAMEAGEFRLPGECVRFIDVSAIERGCPDVFDLGPKFDSPEPRAKWADSTCVLIRKGCKKHHGVALDHFIGKVVVGIEGIRSELVKLRDSFVDSVTEGCADPVARHLAKNFGHLYAAGVLAVRFKTVPWSEELVFKCIRRSYRAARREIKTEAELLRRGLLRLSDQAKKRATLLNAQCKGQTLKHVDGYRRNGIGRTTLTVRAEAFKAWFADPRQPRLVLECLRKRGCLANGHTAPGRGQGIVWAESQPLWPDGTRPRSIVITLTPAL